MTTIIDGTQQGVKLDYGDYVQYGDGKVHQVRGDGNKPQLYLDEAMTAERQAGRNRAQFIIYLCKKLKVRRECRNNYAMRVAKRFMSIYHPA